MILNSPFISGSLTVTGNTIISGSITAPQGIAGTASYASNAELLDGLDSTSFSTTSSFNAASSSFSTRVANTEATASQYVAASASFDSRIISNDATDTTQNARLLSNEQKTGSFATTGSNYFIGTQVITGSVYISSDLIVQGSSSLQNITASAVSIGTNRVILNTDTPILRFGGISVQDSGSTAGRSGSLYWDSVHDHWIYVVPSGSAEGYNSAMLMNGPKNTGSLGDEDGLTSNYIPVAQGEDHIADSIIFQSGSTYIGIGTSVPTAKLDVAGGARFVASGNNSIYVEATGNNIGLVQITGNTKTWNLESNRTANAFTLYESGVGAQFTVAAGGASTFANSVTVGTVLQLNNVANVATIQTNADTNVVALVSSTALVDNKPRIELCGTSYSGTPNTNFYRAGTQIFTSANASTEYMRINSSGQVGIGRTNPEFTLDVNGDIAFNRTNKLMFAGGVAGDRSRSYLTGDGNNNIFIYGPSSNLIATFAYTGYTSLSGYLDIQGNSTITSANDKFAMGVNSTSYAWIQSFGGRPLVLQDSGNNVGIGTTSPNAKLQVFKGTSGNVSSFTSNAVLSGNYSGITLNAQTISGDDWYGAEIRSINTDGNPNYLNPRLGFFTQDYSTYLPSGRTEKMSILGNGRVGIGTTNPSDILDVRKNQNATTNFYLRNTDTTDANSRAYLNVVAGDATISMLALHGSGGGTYIAGTSGRNMYFQQNPGGNVNMLINSSGAITKPYQPLAMGAMSGDQYVPATTFTTISFHTSYGFNQANVGGSWNNSTNYFTTPVTGTYLINAALYTSSVGQIAAFVNGNRNISMVSNGATLPTTWHGTMMLKLTAGDILTLRGYGDGGGYIYLNTYHTWFAIYLLG